MTFSSVAIIVLLILSACSTSTMPVTKYNIRMPRFDASHRFWIYGAPARNSMPFLPYAWMPGEAAKMIKLDPNSRISPNPEEGETEDQATCMEVSVNWRSPYWCGVAFLSGSDSPPWWCEDLRGWYYDFRQLARKRLVFFARGEAGGESIQIKFGAMGDKPFGDSLSFPAETQWLRLSKEWQRFELDLSALKPAGLARICNGFTFVLNQDQQEGSPHSTRFWLDTIFLE